MELNQLRLSVEMKAEGSTTEPFARPHFRGGERSEGSMVIMMTTVIITAMCFNI